MVTKLFLVPLVFLSALVIGFVVGFNLTTGEATDGEAGGALSRSLASLAESAASAAEGLAAEAERTDGTAPRPATEYMEAPQPPAIETLPAPGPGPAPVPELLPPSHATEAGPARGPAFEATAADLHICPQLKEDVISGSVCPRIEAPEGTTSRRNGFEYLPKPAFRKLLHDFDAFCRAHNLTYFLADGALLGAVRHHGFVPWDDDADVFMEDTERARLMRELELQLKAAGMAFESNRWKQMKVYHMRDSRRVGLHRWPFIDVFPFRIVPKDPLDGRQEHGVEKDDDDDDDDDKDEQQDEDNDAGDAHASTPTGDSRPAKVSPGQRAQASLLEALAPSAFDVVLYPMKRLAFRMDATAVLPVRPLFFHGLVLSGPRKPHVYLTGRYLDHNFERLCLATDMVHQKAQDVKVKERARACAALRAHYPFVDRLTFYSLAAALNSSSLREWRLPEPVVELAVASCRAVAGGDFFTNVGDIREIVVESLSMCDAWRPYSIVTVRYQLPLPPVRHRGKKRTLSALKDFRPRTVCYASAMVDTSLPTAPTVTPMAVSCDRTVVPFAGSWGSTLRGSDVFVCANQR